MTTRSPQSTFPNIFSILDFRLRPLPGTIQQCPHAVRHPSPKFSKHVGEVHGAHSVRL